MAGVKPSLLVFCFFSFGLAFFFFPVLGNVTLAEQGEDSLIGIFGAGWGDTSNQIPF